MFFFRCWALFRISHFQSLIFKPVFEHCVGLWDDAPQTGLKASDNFQYIPAMAKNLTLLLQSTDICLALVTLVLPELKALYLSEL